MTQKFGIYLLEFEIFLEFGYWDLEFNGILPVECCGKLNLALKIAYQIQCGLLIALVGFFDVQR